MITGMLGRFTLLLAVLFLIPAAAFGLDENAPSVRLSYKAAPLAVPLDDFLYSIERALSEHRTTRFGAIR